MRHTPRGPYAVLLAERLAGAEMIGWSSSCQGALNVRLAYSNPVWHTVKKISEQSEMYTKSNIWKILYTTGWIRTAEVQKWPFHVHFLHVTVCENKLLGKNVIWSVELKYRFMQRSFYYCLFIWSSSSTKITRLLQRYICLGSLSWLNELWCIHRVILSDLWFTFFPPRPQRTACTKNHIFILIIIYSVRNQRQAFDNESNMLCILQHK